MCHPDVDVVFNDWGVMGLLNSNFPAFKLSAGRLLNKGFKDPRLQPEASRIAGPQAGADALLSGSTFDGHGFKNIWQPLTSIAANRICSLTALIRP
jgi:hypothetical protein